MSLAGCARVPRQRTDTKYYSSSTRTLKSRSRSFQREIGSPTTTPTGRTDDLHLSPGPRIHLRLQAIRSERNHNPPETQTRRLDLRTLFPSPPPSITPSQHPLPIPLRSSPHVPSPRLSSSPRNPTSPHTNFPTPLFQVLLSNTPLTPFLPPLHITPNPHNQSTSQFHYFLSHFLSPSFSQLAEWGFSWPYPLRFDRIDYSR